MASLVETLTTIRQTAGTLTPAAVVEASIPTDAPLHHRFEWDNDVAGHRYRLTQASELIRQAKVQFVDKRGDEKSVRAFIAIRDNAPEPADDYMPVQEVVTSPDLYAIARREYVSALRSLKSQYGHLEDFAAIAARELGVAA